MRNTLITLSSAVQGLQKERGCMSLFLSHKDDPFSDHLQKSFVDSDGALSALQHCLPKLTHLPELFFKLEAILNVVARRMELRSQVCDRNIPTSDVIRQYTLDYISPLLDLLIEVALTDPANNPAKVSAFSSLVQFKERIGRERAMGIRGLADKKFADEEFLNSFRYLLSEQETYERTFLALATDNQKAAYKLHMSDESLRQTAKLRQQIQGRKAGEALEITTESWFLLLTEKMERLQKVVLSLIDMMSNDSIKEPHLQMSTSQLHPAIGEQHRELIKTLPIFSKLSEDVLAGLLQHAQIMEYKKGKILFLEGEQATRFYIVLSGWVKVFKGTAAGDETVLQMLSGGDMISEASIFLNSPYPVSAQVVKRAVILSLPAPIMREKIKDNNEIAVSVLTGMSRHSENLIQEYETIRLKPANERVGWFLLKLLLDQGRVPDLVELPYDKSLIASYLDMKPETFSRSLKKFKTAGFQVNKDSVILPKVGALCGFCDSDLSRVCNIHGTEACPNPDRNPRGLKKF